MAKRGPKPKPDEIKPPAYAAGSPTPPEHLTPEAKDWFNRIVHEFGISDESGLLTLRGAMESFDRAEQARLLLKAEGLTVRDRYDQFRPHPAAGIERDARKLMLQFLKALNLDMEPVRSAPGRPPGR